MPAPETPTGAPRSAALDRAVLAPLFEAAADRVRYALAPIEPEAAEALVASLLPGERALVERAVASRRREFATGRRLAHRLMAELGLPDGPLLRDADRVPTWPADVVGSISHSRELAVVAVARAAALFGIGIDVEPDEAVKEGIERIVCTAAESAWLDRVTAGQPPAERGRKVKLVFSAKEAVYKAFYPRVRVFWNFHDVTLEIDEGAGRIAARLPASADRKVAEGGFVRAEGVLVSAFVVPHRDAAR